jgi:two-component system, cell cycle sensor histidine kinase and response regulator CckA
MKPDQTFALEHASWPAFLADDSGVVREANAAAVTVLGTVMEGEPALSASIWSKENDCTVEEFLSRLKRSSAPMTPLLLRVKGGANSPFNVLVCPAPHEGKRMFLFQLFPAGGMASDTAGAPALAAVPAPPEGNEAAVSAAPGAATNLALDAANAQKQKLDCAMQMIRTVALDFNNALTTILGHTSLVLSRIEPGNPWRSSLMEVEKSAEKAAEIAQDLADFSRQEKDARTHAPGNLNSVVRHAVELFQKPGSAHILWTMQLEKRLFTVTFEEAKMQQAFVRVIENAVEAVGREGRITVRTLNHSFSEPVISPTVQLAAGHYVCVEFTDNGAGIPQDMLPRIFEPFFTTKPSPHRGLGLAWVYGIATNHGGVVSVSSPPAQGTTVRIYLPAQEKIVKDQATKVEDLRGGQTVLFVDDEEMLLNLGRTVLSAFGYKVITANSGTRALELFTQSPSQFDLVVTDLVMPGMSGRELIDQLRRLAPTLPILSTSGYLRSAGDGEDENYLRKPFTSQDLLRRVKQLLLQAHAS